MVDNIGSSASVYNSALLRVGGSVRERLISKLENQKPQVKPQTVIEAAPIVQKRPPAVQLDHMSKANEFGGSQVADLITDAVAQAPAAADTQALQETPESFLFKAGTEYSGTFSNGRVSLLGVEGRYFVEPGYQSIKFEIGGFTGHLLSATKGIAYNPDTQRMVTFDLKLGEGEFKISNVKDFVATEPPGKRAPDFEGKLSGSTASFSNGMQIDFKDNGQIKIRLGDPAAKDGYLEGDGYVDEKGNLVAMFQNGAAISGQYVRGKNIFNIFNYSVLKSA